MRCDLTAALLHNPEILYLDEPTIGLDVVAKEQVRQFLRQVNAERQVTVILTTHDLNDVEKVCQRLIIIDSGKIIYDGGIDALKETVTAKPGCSLLILHRRILTFNLKGVESNPTRWKSYLACI